MATFVDALNYSKQNPDSDFAKEFRRRIESGQLDSEAKAAGVDLSKISRPAPQPEGMTLGGFGTNLAKSFGGAVAGIANAVVHPIDTLTSLGKVAFGGAEKLFGAAPDANTQAFDSVAQYFDKRYGVSEFAKGDFKSGARKIVDTIYQDPVGFATDFYSAFSPVKSLLGKGAKAGEVAAASKIAPFASSFDEKAAAVAKARGVDLPASSLSTSPAVQTLEAISGKGLFGNRIANKIEAAGERLNKIADTAVRSSGAVPDAYRAGEVVIQGFKKYKTAFEDAKNLLYDEAEAALKGSVKTTAETTAGEHLARVTDNTKGVLEGILKDKAAIPGGGENAAYFQKRLDGLDKTTTFQGLRAFKSEVGKKLQSFSDPIVNQDRAYLSKLYGALERDIDASALAIKPELAGALAKATSFYADGIKKINSAFGKSIKRLADSGQPDKIVAALFRPSMSVDDVPKIFEIIGEKGQAAVQSTFLDKLFASARSKASDSPTFTGTGLTTQIRKYGEPKLQAILTPEQFSALKDLETLSQSLARGQKVAQGSQTGFIARIAAQLFTAGVNPWNALKFVMSDAAFSKFIASEAGQKLLTEGVLSPKQRVLKAAKTAAGAAALTSSAGKVQELNP